MGGLDQSHTAPASVTLSMHPVAVSTLRALIPPLPLTLSLYLLPLSLF